MNTTILFVHGRSWKPPEDVLLPLYVAALRHGLCRDDPDVVPKFDRTEVKMAYYGDLSAKVLKRMGRVEPEPDDFAPCFRSLDYLTTLKKEAFLVKKNRKKVPKEAVLREQLADKLGEPYTRLGLDPGPVWNIAPDLKTGLDASTVYGKSIRSRLAKPLREAMLEEKRILIIGHSLGSVLAWDVCWQFSWGQPMKSWPIDWISIGSPLGNDLVQGFLLGANKRGARKYPKNVRRWDNIAARGDYVCHDKTVRNDFLPMTQYGACKGIRDHLILNPAPEASQSDPQHSPLGYLIHPTTASLVADWLNWKPL